MKGGRRFLIALVGAVAFLGLLAGGVVWSGRSLVIIDNRGETPLTLEVETVPVGDFRWAGDLKPGQRLYRIAKFTGDGSIRAVCRDGDGVYRSTGGHVSAGWPYRVDAVASGCASIQIEADRLP
ncbi:hypothetical protein [Brevundimonas sp.]|uniref:hypothetical protein n=1 Tax=Brevundimonas sp. TaxID=1871086 RepID=UPI003F6F0F58